MRNVKQNPHSTSAAHGRALKPQSTFPLQNKTKQNFALPNAEKWDNASKQNVYFYSPQLRTRLETSVFLMQKGFNSLQCWPWAFNHIQASTNLKSGKGPRNLSTKMNAWNSTMLSTRAWRYPKNRLEQPWHIWCFSKSPLVMAPANLCSCKHPASIHEMRSPRIQPDSEIPLTTSVPGI